MRFFPWERALVMLVAAVVGLYGGIAAGLFATSIRFVQLLLFRGPEVAGALFGPEREMWARYFFERLTAAHWHLEFAALAALILGAVAVVEWLGISHRLPLFEARRLRAVALAATLGLALYYPLVLLQTFNGTFHKSEGALLELLEHAPRWSWVIGPALGALLAALIVRYLSPESGGHGVVEVIEAVHQRTPIRGRVALWKSLAAGLVIGSGGSAGREGPVVHLGGAVASSLSRFLALPPGETSMLLAAGAGAGIAASFQAPLAGSLFALEIVLSDFGVRSFAPVVLACVTATATSRALLGGGTELRMVSWSLSHPSEIAVYLLLGLFAGLCGLVYIKSVHGAEEWFHHRVKLPPELKAALGGLAVGCIGLLAPRVLGTGIESMNAALAGQLTLGALLLALVFKLVATSATLGSGVPGGSFFPAVFLGAMLGGAFGRVAQAALPGIVSSADAYAAVGMGAVVAGATLAPLTGVLMMFELTGSYQIVLPLLVACGAAAALVQGVLDGSIYTLGLKKRLSRIAAPTQRAASPAAAPARGAGDSSSVRMRAGGALPMDIPQRFNIGAELIDRNLREGRGPSTAIVSAGRTLTYAQLGALVDRTAAAFLRAGVQREERVLMVMPDSPELAACYLAAMKIGAVAVPCNPLLRAADYAYFIEESRAALLVTQQAFVEKLPPHSTRMLTVGVDFEKFLAETPDPGKLEAAPTSRDEAAFWLWTSGSTGRPKAAVHAHQDWPHCCELYGRGILGLTANDRCFSASKLFHAYGLGNALAFPFWVGASTILAPERPTPDVAYRNISEGRPTVFFGVPTLYAAMLQVPDVEKRFDLSSLRVCVSAGEPLPAELFSRWKARFKTEILDGIGSTEVLHIYVSPRAGAAKPGSTGLPVPGYDVRIIDEGGATVAPGGTGDLIVRGPSTALFYWNRREQTRSRMRGDWFFSGDKFRQTEDGEFHYVGRSDDMFKCGGEWISPTDVESVLVAHAAVLECAVVPMESEGLLRPRAHVVLVQGREASPALAEELRQHVRGRCAGYMVPREILFVPELPKTATGKIQRYVLRGE